MRWLDGITDNGHAAAAAKSLQSCPTLCNPINCSMLGSHSFIFSLNLLKLMSIEEKAMATHSSTLAWKMPWMEEPGGLQSMGSHRVRHD